MRAYFVDSTSSVQDSGQWNLQRQTGLEAKVWGRRHSGTVESSVPKRWKYTVRIGVFAHYGRLFKQLISQLFPAQGCEDADMCGDPDPVR